MLELVSPTRPALNHLPARAAILFVLLCRFLHSAGAPHPLHEAFTARL